MKAANLLINNHGQLQIADFGLARPYHDPGRAWDDGGWRGGTHSYTSMVVTRWYRPPELLAGDRKYGPPIDMWGLGCILAEMINRKPIFKGVSEIHQLELISGICGSPSEGCYAGWTSLPGVKNADPQGRPDQEPDIPGRHDFGRQPRRVIEYFTQHPFSVRKELADLIDKLLVLDPTKRLTAKEALEHDWFWQPPYPADPQSLPKYQPSKELDRQRREQQKQQSLAMQYSRQPHHHANAPRYPNEAHDHRGPGRLQSRNSYGGQGPYVDPRPTYHNQRAYPAPRPSHPSSSSGMRDAHPGSSHPYNKASASPANPYMDL